MFTMICQGCTAVFGLTRRVYSIFTLLSGALCFVLAPRDATGAMTTLQVCCHVVMPTIIPPPALDVRDMPHNELLGFHFAV